MQCYYAWVICDECSVAEWVMPGLHMINVASQNGLHLGYITEWVTPGLHVMNAV